MKKPRQYSLVRWTTEGLSEAMKAEYPFKEEAVYVFFGEIPNMPEHCIVADHETGKIYSGYHTADFAELSEEDV